MAKITLEKLREADGNDGRLDGAVTAQELDALDPSAFDAAAQSDLISAEGLLPYEEYLDDFDAGRTYWKGLTSDADAIPILNKMALGKKAAELKEKLQIQFWSKMGKEEATRRLKAPSILFHDTIKALSEMVDVQWPTSEKLDSAMSKFRTRMLETKIKDPQALFEYAANQTLSVDLQDFFNALPRAISDRMKAGIKNIPIHEMIAPQVAAEYIEATAADLAYRGTYFFPKLEDRLWGGAIASVHLTYSGEFGNPLEERCYLDESPYLGNEVKKQTVGQYRAKEKILTLPLIGVDSALVSPASAFRVGDDTIGHETDHAIQRITGGRTWKEWFQDLREDVSSQAKMKAIVDFFTDLSVATFSDIFFGNDYGHPDGMKLWGSIGDPQEETHAQLATLLALGFDFPDILYNSLRAKETYEEEEIGKIHDKLVEYRNLVVEVWGYRGHPAWADKTK